MRAPQTSYRLQFGSDLDFTAAAAIMDYLAALGISHVYASPVFQARPGSGHGYDVVEPARLNPELGTEQDFESLMQAVISNGLGWIQDIVPNHMAYAPGNAMLMDVLENGAASPYHDFFDVDWDHFSPSLKGRLLAPFLGRSFAECLEDGEIQLRYLDDQGFCIGYYEHSFPLDVASYPQVLLPVVPDILEELDDKDEDALKLLGVLYLLKSLPPESSEERDTQVRFAKRMLRELHQANPVISRHIQRAVTGFNGSTDQPGTFDDLENLLSGQHFRLSFWKVATEEINYRRFFNINELISLNMQRREVFERTHELILRGVRSGWFTGLRVDHVDGLYDPGAYLGQLRKHCPSAYLVVEKILEWDEDLPRQWPVQGTTGYEFMNRVTQLFCDPGGRRSLDRLYASVSGSQQPYRELVADKKRLIIGKEMAGDVDNLAQLLKQVSARDRYGRDITLFGLKRALVELLARFPVYRTYIDERGISEQDRHIVTSALDESQRSLPSLEKEFLFIRRYLLLSGLKDSSPEERRLWLAFVHRFQQLTGPLMAKGFEDTLLYVYNRLLSLNEVGGNPERFGCPPGAFHDWMRRRAELWPLSMNALSTHDNKRGEDVRARLNVLSELPEEWSRLVRSWRRGNAKARSRVDGLRAPDGNDELLLYQTLVGMWPFEPQNGSDLRDRVQGYLTKAVREAKVHSSWVNPNPGYEQALHDFAASILDPESGSFFLESFLPFQHRVARLGIYNSLAQTLIKITAPGVPDFYQGSELWDLSLVDPDNRRPVDFTLRRKLLSEIRDRFARDRDALLQELLDSRRDGRIKLFLVHRALTARTASPRLFEKGAYLPLRVRGGMRRHVLAFARQHGARTAVVVVPRFLAKVLEDQHDPLGDFWQDTAVILPPAGPKRFSNLLTGQTHVPDGRALPLNTLMDRFPAALCIGRKTQR
ncbi:MAG: malto-oligosyltrehalose synthase [Desulfohalobiaceae bacterium]